VLRFIQQVRLNHKHRGAPCRLLCRAGDSDLPDKHASLDSHLSSRPSAQQRPVQAIPEPATFGLPRCLQVGFAKPLPIRTILKQAKSTTNHFDFDFALSLACSDSTILSSSYGRLCSIWHSFHTSIIPARDPASTREKVRRMPARRNWRPLRQDFDEPSAESHPASPWSGEPMLIEALEQSGRALHAHIANDHGSRRRG